jgi:hypothetical protein
MIIWQSHNIIAILVVTFALSDNNIGHIAVVIHPAKSTSSEPLATIYQNN